jgi:arginine decarboxylase
VPDAWALEQLFPIVPIHGLNKAPTEYATLCDITCDSDGIINKFVDLHDVKPVLELHPFVPGEAYYLAFMLVGAYQEVMGNNHNLFGAPNEAHIFIDDNGYLIKKMIRGTSIGEAAGQARYERNILFDGFRQQVQQQIKLEEITEAEGLKLTEYYESRFDAYTYLSSNGRLDSDKRSNE